MKDRLTFWLGADASRVWREYSEGQLSKNGARAFADTIGRRMEENRGIGAGFDTLRLALAVLVILWHCVPLATGSTEEILATPVWVGVYVIIPVFFALSGFLVTGSALRLTLGKFAASRILRIVPALAVDTLITVLLIAPLATTLPLGEFFTQAQTWEYLFNIIGEIRYYLPGVFEDNPYEGVVNGSLWTIRPELACYGMMFLLIAFRFVHSWKIVALATVCSFVVFALLSVNLQGVIPQGLLAQQGLQKLVAFFLFGALAFHFRDRIPYSHGLAALSVAVIVIGGFVGNGDWAFLPEWVVPTAPFLVYLTVYLGVTRLPKVPFFDRGDYSYGIYLYGFPIQQSVVHFLGVDNVWLLFAISMPFIVILAVFSWHAVEKPTLTLRKNFSMAAKLEKARQEGRA